MTDREAVAGVERQVGDADIIRLWQPALDGVAGVVVKTTDDGAATGVDLVEVYLPVSLAPAGRLFGRINVSIATP